jgi:hypothetical protein
MSQSERIVANEDMRPAAAQSEIISPTASDETRSGPANQGALPG